MLAKIDGRGDALLVALEVFEDVIDESARLVIRQMTS